MTPKRAFWQALGLVAIPSLVVWTVLLSIGGYNAEEWRSYLMCFLVPILILLPFFYHNYRKYGAASRPRVYTKRQHWSFAVAGIILATLLIWGAFLKRNGWALTGDLGLGLVWLCVALNHLFKALKDQSSEAPSLSVK